MDQRDPQQDRYAREFETLRSRYGVDTAADFQDMLSSMETQLCTLYADAENAAAGSADEAAFENLEFQLKALYAERERLTERTGVAALEEVDEMIESLSTQLSNLYAEREDCIVIDGRNITITGPRRVVIRKKK
jgi:hypothetical protein